MLPIGMAIAVLFSLSVVCAGWVTLRILGLARGAVGLGLAPGTGLALLTIVSTWLGQLGAPPPLAGAVALGLTLGGAGLALRDRLAIGQTMCAIVHGRLVGWALLVAALVAPMLAIGLAFAGAQVPLSSHDGAAHTEAIQGFRYAQSWPDWYPPGMAALFAGWLQLVPWLDTAAGAFELGLSLPLLAVLSVFGLGAAVWRDVRMAGASALMLGFTYLFPSFPELWSGWPLAIGLILVMTTWTIGIQYLERPRLRWGALAGFVLAAIVLVHGTEVYTLALILPVLLIGAWQRVNWSGLLRQAGVAAALGVACAAVYLPTLVGWAGAGGAYTVGLQETQGLFGTPAGNLDPAFDPFVGFGLGALGIDLPVRLGLLVVGSVWAWRRRLGRSVLWIGLLFVAGAATFWFLTAIPLVHQVYAITFPWGMHYRMFMVLAIAQALLAGAGGVVAWRSIDRWMRSPGGMQRRLRRARGLLLVTWLGLITWAMATLLAYPADRMLGYTADDAVAMTWLGRHVLAGEVVLNDGYADAGIWAPYKAGVAILLPRSEPLDPAELRARTLVLEDVTKLDQVPEAATAACAHRVAYVYHGAAASSWDKRRLPGLDELRASAVLRQVFSQHDAVVFEVNLACARSAVAEATPVALLSAGP